MSDDGSSSVVRGLAFAGATSLAATPMVALGLQTGRRQLTLAVGVVVVVVVVDVVPVLPAIVTVRVHVAVR